MSLLRTPLQLAARAYPRQSLYHTSAAVLATEVKMPAMSPTMTDGKIARWAVKEGDKIQSGQVLLEIETDKATIEVESPEDGILAKILASPHSGQIPVGQIIGILADLDEDWKNVKIPTTSAAQIPQKAPQATAPTPASSPAPQKPATAAASPPTLAKFSSAPLSPAVANLIARHKLDPSAIPATGPKNRLLKGDVLAFLENPRQPAQQPAAVIESPTKAPAKKPAATSVASTFKEKPTSAPRKKMAQDYVKGKALLPHHYLSADCDLGAVPGFQKYLLETQQASVSTLTILTKAAAVALRQIPEANAVWGDESAKLLDQVNISVVVDTKEGPRFPVLRNANQLGLLQISDKLQNALADAPDTPGVAGNLRISDFGSTGLSNAAEILDTVSTSALSISSPKKVPVVSDDGNLSFSTVATLTFTADARAVDPEVAEKFLLTLKQLLATPTTLL